MTRVTLQLRNSDHSLIRYQDEGDRNFAPNPKHAKSAPQSLKILSGVDYDLKVELRDDGNCIDSLLGIKLDDALLEVLHSEQGHSSNYNCSVYTMRCKWVLSALHFGPTPNGLRDEVPLELLYSHSGAQHSACFKLQCKLYDRHRPKRVAKAQKHGKPFFCATCSFDAAKTQNTAAAQQWTFEEAVEDSTGAYTGSSSLASHRAPPKLVDEADSPDSQNNKTAKTEEAVELS